MKILATPLVTRGYGRRLVTIQIHIYTRVHITSRSYNLHARVRLPGSKIKRKFTRKPSSSCAKKLLNPARSGTRVRMAWRTRTYPPHRSAGSSCFVLSYWRALQGRHGAREDPGYGIVQTPCPWRRVLFDIPTSYWAQRDSALDPLHIVTCNARVLVEYYELLTGSFFFRDTCDPGWCSYTYIRDFVEKS